MNVDTICMTMAELNKIKLNRIDEEDDGDDDNTVTRQSATLQWKRGEINQITIMKR
jgi:hypothetical protein